MIRMSLFIHRLLIIIYITLVASTATSVGDILSGALLTRAATVILINEYDY